MKILLTGATGFLGNRLKIALSLRSDLDVTAVVRRPVENSGSNTVMVPTIDASVDWSSVLTNQQIIIHTAARSHIMKEQAADPIAEYRRINVEGTLKLAHQAVDAGVKRFIFISSIKVNGEQTSLGQSFTANDVPAPIDAYGMSKWEAEQGLQQLASETELEVVVIRPPLIYGPNVKGNFASIIKLVSRGLPLPLGAIHNQRSFVAVDNLIDLIVRCIDHPNAANQVFLASDGQDLSTTELLCGVARSMGKPVSLIPIPASLLMLGGTLLGKRSVAQRLLGSLQVDASKAQKVLGWKPPISVEEGLRRCFEHRTK